MKPPTPARSAPSNQRNALSLRNILVPIDFSELSLGAIGSAQRIAQRFGAIVHLAYVQDYAYSATFFSPAAPEHTPGLDLEELRGAAEERLKALAKEHGLTGTCRAEIGAAPYDLICGIARKVSADLIVTPTHGRTGLKRALLGSTAERLVQYSPCPVLVVRERTGKRAARPKATSRDAIDTILAPVDFSESSAAGLKYAIGVARKYSARIMVLHVVDLGPLVVAGGYALLFDPSAFEKKAMADAENRMVEFVRGVKFGEVKFQTEVIAGGAVDGICRTAAAEDADLIITATHGLTGFKHVLIGSTAEVVVRHAPCSVLVVPSHPNLRGPTPQPRSAKRQSVTKARRAKPPGKKAPDVLATRRARKIVRHPVPERRRTNKFRESHAK